MTDSADPTLTASRRRLLEETHNAIVIRVLIRVHPERWQWRFPEEPS